MSVVITPDSVLGPFKQIEVLADRLRCDGAELPFAVLGSYQISEDDSLAPHPIIDDSEQRTQIRKERNQKLTECDWTQLDDTPLDNVAKAQWAAYRQALRDVPDQTGFPSNVVWPSQPN